MQKLYELQMFKLRIQVSRPPAGTIAAKVRAMPMEVQCDRCGLHTWTSVGAAGRRDATICRGCHCTLLLNDGLGTARRTERAAERVIDEVLDRLVRALR